MREVIRYITPLAERIIELEAAIDYAREKTAMVSLNLMSSND